MRRLPCAHRKPRGIGGFARGLGKAGDLDRAFARQRHPHGGAGLVLIGRPQRVVDHTDAAAFGQDGKFGSQIRHRGRPQEPGRRRDRRAPFTLLRQRLDFRRQQACDRAALQAGKGAGGERRGLPAIGAGGLEDGQGYDILEVRNIECWANLAEAGALRKRDFLTSDDIIQPSEAPASPLRAIPPLTALLAFERAASQLSFRRAARDLSLSPSAISHQIRGLEEQFGIKLFVRGARSVRLTADGERYFAKVSVALAALQDASRDMLRHRRDADAELWISSLPFFTSAVLIPALPEFKRRHPALTLRIEATHQYADFNASRVDVAIRYGREHSTGLKFEPLVAVKGLPVCAPALVKGGLKTPEDLSREVLIHLTTQPRAWPAWLKEAGLSAPHAARPSLARQRAGDAGGRRTGARRHARHVAADQGAAGLWQKADRALCVRGRA